MDEFLRQNYHFLTKSVEALAAITGIICYRKYKHTPTKYFIYYLIYIFFVDFFAAYPRYLIKFDLQHITDGTVFKRNYLWYAVFGIIGGMLFFARYYLKIIKRPLFKQTYRYLAYAIILLSIMAIVLKIENYYGGNVTFVYVNYLLFVVLGSVFYFIEILQSNTILTFYKSFSFYVSTVLFIWVLIITPVSFFDIYFTSADWSFVFLKWKVFLSANIFMYLTFTFALIYCKPDYD